MPTINLDRLRTLLAPEFVATVRRLAVVSVRVVTLGAVVLGAVYVARLIEDPRYRFRIFYSGLYDTIFNEKGSVDLVFTGSSRAQTMFGAQELHKEIFRDRTDPVVYNISTSQRDACFQQLVLRELMQHRTVGTIFLEINGTDPRPGFEVHPFLHITAGLGDIWDSAQRQTEKSWYERLRIAQYTLLAKLSRMVDDAWKGGLYPGTRLLEPRPAKTRDLLSANPIRPHSIRYGHLDKWKDPHIPLVLTDPIENRLIACIDAINADAKKDGTRLVLLYVPKLGEPGLAPQQIADVERRFDVPFLSPSAAQLESFYPDAYADRGHASNRGRAIYASWLAGELLDRGLNESTLRITRADSDHTEP